MAEAVHIPVTVKMRLGWSRETENCVELAEAVEEAGAMAITVHGRTREDFYTGHADWEKSAKWSGLFIFLSLETATWWMGPVRIG